jgi:uncharacterized repeat protein (TIGR01451 family)
MTIEVTVLNSTDLSKTTWVLHNDACVTSDTSMPNEEFTHVSVNTTVISTFVQFRSDLKVIAPPDDTVQAGALTYYLITVENLGPYNSTNVYLRINAFSDSGVFDLWPDFDDRHATLNPVVLLPSWCTYELNISSLDVKNASSPSMLGFPFEVDGGAGKSDPSIQPATGRWVVMLKVKGYETQNINFNLNVFSSSDRWYDPNMLNNQAEWSIHVTDAADLNLTKTESPNPVVTSQACAVNYVLNVTNKGPSTAVTVVVVDQLPAGLTIKSITVSQGSFCPGVPGDESQPTIWYVGTLAPGAFATMIINTTIPQYVTPQILWNNAHVTSDTFDPDNSNNMASTRTLVVHYTSQLSQLNSVPDNQPLGLPTIELTLLTSLITAAAAFTVFKRTTVRRFISLIRTKKE